MRILLLLLAASVFGYGVLQIDKIDPNNYVKIYIANHVIEIKLLGFILLVLGIMVVLYALWSVARMLLGVPKRYTNWRQRRQSQDADAALGAGYLALIKGEWQRAEQYLTKRAKHSNLPYLNYLAAAQAAQEQNKLAERDKYLLSAYTAAPQERLAIGLAKARLHQQAGQLKEVLATLNDISKEGQANAQYTAMLLQIHQQMGNWSAAQALLPKAKKQQVLSTPQLADNLAHASLQQSSNPQEAWNALPNEQKNRPDNVQLYARHLIAQDDISNAEKLIRKTLNSAWNDDLASLYSELPTHCATKKRRVIEGWLATRPDHPQLNLGAGRFALAEKDFDLAKKYLRKAISHGQLPQAYALLGEVYEACNESDKTAQLYRAGMMMLAKQDQPTQAATTEKGNELPANVADRE